MRDGLARKPMKSLDYIEFQSKAFENWSFRGIAVSWSLLGLRHCEVQLP